MKTNINKAKQLYAASVGRLLAKRLASPEFHEENTVDQDANSVTATFYLAITDSLCRLDLDSRDDVENFLSSYFSEEVEIAGEEFLGSMARGFAETMQACN